METTGKYSTLLSILTALFQFTDFDTQPYITLSYSLCIISVLEVRPSCVSAPDSAFRNNLHEFLLKEKIKKKKVFILLLGDDGLFKGTPKFNIVSDSTASTLCSEQHFCFA